MKTTLLLLSLTGLLFGADRTFLLETHSWTPDTPTYLGNGLIGPSSTPLGTLMAGSGRRSPHRRSACMEWHRYLRRKDLAESGDVGPGAFPGGGHVEAELAKTVRIIERIAMHLRVKASIAITTPVNRGGRKRDAAPVPACLADVVLISRAA
jgi:hypothetical protein